MPRPDRVRSLRVVDVQVGGDVHRVVLGGVAPAPGRSVRDWMHHVENHADGLRRLLISEPYGGAHMCANLVVPPSLPEARHGFVIMEVMGYPFYSGSNTIATAAAVLENGLVPMSEGEQQVFLESPGGLITVVARNEGGRVREVVARGGPAFILAHDQAVRVPGLGRVAFHLAWSGGLYVLVEAAALGLVIERAAVDGLCRVAGDIIEAVQRDFAGHRHPELGDVGLPRFLHFMAPVEQGADGSLRSRSATYGHPGVIWRSPTGTGTSARLALMAREGAIAPGARLETVSPWGNAFLGTFIAHASVGGHAAVDSTVTARPYTLARSELVVDLDDPLVQEFHLDEILFAAP